jgi:hypothetical protein
MPRHQSPRGADRLEAVGWEGAWAGQDSRRRRQRRDHFQHASSVVTGGGWTGERRRRRLTTFDQSAAPCTARSWLEFLSRSMWLLADRLITSCVYRSSVTLLRRRRSPPCAAWGGRQHSVELRRRRGVRSSAEGAVMDSTEPLLSLRAGDSGIDSLEPLLSLKAGDSGIDSLDPLLPCCAPAGGVERGLATGVDHSVEGF